MNMQARTIAGIGLTLLAILCAGVRIMANPDSAASESKKHSDSKSPGRTELATFGSGCFWCTEAVFEQLRGVKSVVSGYSGGETPNPTYEAICTGLTGHAEVVQIAYDPAEISYDELLKVFWQTHDPTTLNRQGNDVGTQYRSVIFYHHDEQRRIAEGYKKQLDDAETFRDPIVTEIAPFEKFYPAEKYHQEYYRSNPSQGYCAFVIRPKVEKFRQEFKALLQDSSQAAEAARR
jgi:peptide-methionine (S)-S-oxide reductase